MAPSIKGLVEIERIGGVLLEDLVRVDELLHQARVLAFGRFGTERQYGESEEKSKAQAKRPTPHGLRFEHFRHSVTIIA